MIEAHDLERWNEKQTGCDCGLVMELRKADRVGSWTC